MRNGYIRENNARAQKAISEKYAKNIYISAMPARKGENNIVVIH